MLVRVRRLASPLRRLWPVILLFAGCRAVLGIEEPIEIEERRGGDAGAAGEDASGAGGGETTGGGGSAGSTDGGTLGDPCDEDGAVQCAGVAQEQRLECRDGSLQPADPCGEGTLCDTTSGECESVVEDCVGRSPGESFCGGRTWTRCGPDLVSVETETCDSVQSCRPAGCAICLDNEFTCDGDRLLKCREDLTGFDLLDTCDEEPCNPDAGACTSLACLPDQLRCNGDVLERCNDGQSAFDVVEECGEGLCDRVNFECDACVPASTSCTNERTLETCADDGQGSNQDACPSGGFCIEPGICVGCRGVADCPAGDECEAPSCNAGTKTCSLGFEPPRTPCPDGLCDAAGECVECINAGDCDNDNECLEAICLADGSCDLSPLEPNDSCSGGVCDGDGECVECVDPSPCDASGQCYDPVCTTDNRCDETPKGAGTGCGTVGMQCNGSGGCVECLVNTDCGTQEVCRGGSCLPAVHNVGWDTAFPEQATARSVSFAYAFRLPTLTYDARLLKFGIYGSAAAVTQAAAAKMAIYGGNATNPTGNPLAVTSVVITLANPGPTDRDPNSTITLTKGTIYWLVFKVSAAVPLRMMAPGVNGVRFGNPYGDNFPMNPTGFAGEAGDYAMFIRVQDLE